VAGALVALSVAGCGGGHAAQRPARPGAVVVAERRVGPRLVDLRMRSPALRRVVSVRLLTPVGWQPRSARRWPVLFLLHGCCDDYRAWSRSSDIGTLTRLRRVLVVMPEGGAAGFYSDWRGGARTRWETFHTRELPALLAARFGAGRARAIAGLSMGGLGAMDYAARHRGLFRSAASFSGVLHPRADPRFWTGLFSQYQSADDVWGDPVADRGVWAAHDPTSLAGRLRGVGLFVSSGDRRGGDPIEAVVGRESRAFVARLRRAGVGVRADLYRGGRHDWRYWQRELHRALPTLLTPLGV
jgi:diacylglycerol O-acyltransferase/trehalose O-mycolyltransferase